MDMEILLKYGTDSVWETSLRLKNGQGHVLFQGVSINLFKKNPRRIATWNIELLFSIQLAISPIAEHLGRQDYRSLASSLGHSGWAAIEHSMRITWEPRARNPQNRFRCGPALSVQSDSLAGVSFVDVDGPGLA